MFSGMFCIVFPHAKPSQVYHRIIGYFNMKSRTKTSGSVSVGKPQSSGSIDSKNAEIYIL